MMLEGQSAGSDEDSRNVAADAVAYCGLLMKETGHVEESIRLYKSAVTQHKTSASLVLNLMHVYELRVDYIHAVAWGLRYLDSVKAKLPGVEQITDLIVHGKAPAKPLDPSQINAKALGGDEKLLDFLAVAFTILKLLYLMHPGWGTPNGSVGEEARPSYLSVLRSVYQKDITKVPSERIASLGKGACSESVIDWSAFEGAANKFGFDATVDSSAYQAYVLEEYVKLFTSLHSSIGGDLKKTKVRNENAYFLVVSMIVDYRKMQDNPIEGPYEPIFMIGDSHVMTAGWERFTCDGKKYVIIPNLCTGLKVHHLRAESTFYTKRLFWNHVGNLPKKHCKVVFNFGEIDMREGIVTAYHRGYYESLDSALQALSENFLNVAAAVRKKLPSCDLFAHPVPVVISQTRILTHTWNKLLADEQNQKEWNKQKLRILKFASVYEGVSDQDCLDGTELMFSQYMNKELLPMLKFDEIHMSPNYIHSHFAPALASALQISFAEPKKKSSLDDLC
jgi:hypothetical protein